MVQGLRIYLAMQGTPVLLLVWEDRHVAEQLTHASQLPKPTRLVLVPGNKRGHCSEKPRYSSEEWPLLITTGENLRSNKDPAKPRKKERNLKTKQNKTPKQLFGHVNHGIRLMSLLRVSISSSVYL